jgi:hypothetical protein
VVFTAGRRRKLAPGYTTSLEEENTLLKAYIGQLEKATGTSFLPSHISELLANHGDEHEESLGRPSLEQGKIDDAETREFEVAIDDPAIDNVSSMIWKMNISDGGISSFVGPSGNFCFPLPRSTSPVLGSVQSSELTSNPACMSVAPDLSIPTNPNLEASGSVTELLACFCCHINSVHHFLDEEALPSLMSTSQSEPNHDLLRNAVLSAAALFSDDPYTREQVSSSYAEAAAADALRCCRDYPSIVTMQALAILCWRELGLENENEAWLYNGAFVEVRCCTLSKT